MEMNEFCHLINLPDEMVHRLRMRVVSKKMTPDWMEGFLTHLMNREKAAQTYRELKVVLGEDEGNWKMLGCQLECARRLFDRYQEKQIPLEIYVATMKCFTRFLNECRDKNGSMFFDRGWWTYRQISMQIFRLGELEYELKEHQGSNIISIHIPSDADLSPKAVDESLRQADIFFHTCFSNFPVHKYICSSWLLSPALKPLLADDSSILSFQKRFTITAEDKTDREYIEWLFQVPADTTPESLPENTSLQRGVKEWLLDGGSIGCAHGILQDLPLQK